MIILLYDFSLDNDCNYDNLTVYERNMYGNIYSTNTFIGTYCGEHAPQSLTLRNEVIIIFQTDLSFRQKGFEIHYEIDGNIIEIDNILICKKYNTDRIQYL